MDRLTAERMLVKVVEFGSFSAAARHFGTGSGQASKLITRLEADLGVKLLHRTTRAVTVTEAGRLYTSRLAGLIEAFDDLAAELQSTSLSPAGRIRLSVPLSFGTIILAPLLAGFALAHPEITLDVAFDDRFARLVDEGFDAAVRVGPSPDQTLVGRRLCSVRLLTLAAPAYLAINGIPEVPSDLVRHRCILDTNFREPGLWPFAAGLLLPVRGQLSFSDASACLCAAEAGLGLACSPDFAAKASLAAGRVVLVLQAYAPPPLEVQILTPDARFLPAKLRLLIDFLVEGLRPR